MDDCTGADAGGYPGSPYFKITIAGTDRTLAATEDGELVVLPAFTGAPEQLWRIDQLADGSWRIMPKAIPNSKEADGAFGYWRELRDAVQIRSEEHETALAAEDALDGRSKSEVDAAKTINRRVI